jgi:hypothetical protein
MQSRGGTTQQRSQKSSRPLVVGTNPLSRPTNSAVLKAAKPIVNKSVYCIDNVYNVSTTDDICRFVSSLSVRVISCFEVKPRQPYLQRRQHIEPDSKAYRLCIRREDSDKLQTADRWPADITISTWHYKAKVPGLPSVPQSGSDSLVAAPLTAVDRDRDHNAAPSDLDEMSANVDDVISGIHNATDDKNDTTIIYEVPGASSGTVDIIDANIVNCHY